MKKYFIVLVSFIKLSLYRFILRKNVIFENIQSHSIFSSILMKEKSYLKLGMNTQFDAWSEVFVGAGAKVSIGSRTYLNKRCIVSAHDTIIIGENCLFGPDVKIYDNNHSFEKGFGLNRREHKTKPIVIEDNCWLASNVVVLAGSKIGKNSVIGASVVIKGEVPENSIVTSNTSLNIRPIS